MALMLVRYTFLLVSLFAFVAVSGYAQTGQVKKAPVQPTSPASGVEMFNSYCASCHGKDAKGNGPAAAALKVSPANLTELAKKNNGKFPADHVANVLRSGVSGAHGSPEMPVWGPLFSDVSGRDDTIVQMRTANLVRYLESLQAK